jgi:hypothetical protein
MLRPTDPTAAAPTANSPTARASVWSRDSVDIVPSNAHGPIRNTARRTINRRHSVVHFPLKTNVEYAAHFFRVRYFSTFLYSNGSHGNRATANLPYTKCTSIFHTRNVRVGLKKRKEETKFEPQDSSFVNREEGRMENKFGCANLNTNDCNVRIRDALCRKTISARGRGLGPRGSPPRLVVALIPWCVEWGRVWGGGDAARWWDGFITGFCVVSNSRLLGRQQVSRTRVGGAGRLGQGGWWQGSGKVDLRACTETLGDL